MKTAGNIICFVFLLMATGSFGQDVVVDQLLDSASSRLAQIESYKVDATFIVDIDFVNMPEKKARIHFEAPNKLDIDSEGFLMIPKVGLKPMIKQLDLDRYHAMFIGEENVNDEDCYLVKMIPKKGNNKMVLSTLWIRKEDFLISRWETFLKKSGSVMVDLFYDTDILPNQMVFSFEISKMNIPLKYFGNEVEIDDSAFDSGEVEDGRVIINLENYHIK